MCNYAASIFLIDIGPQFVHHVVQCQILSRECPSQETVVEVDLHDGDVLSMELDLASLSLFLYRIYVHVFTYIGICICARMYTHIHTHTYIYIFVSVCIYI